MSDTQLAIIIKARQMLEQAKTFDEIKQVMSISEQARLYAKRQGLGLESQNLAAEIYLDSTRKFGDALKELERSNGGRPHKNSANNGGVSEYKVVLEETNTSHQDAGRFERIASIPEEKYKAIVAETKEAKRELTTAALLREVPHVSHNSGNNEWYTPAEYIEAAREVLEEIDLDPASSEIANQNVKAKKFYSVENDGLQHKWRGRVWMNPPYASDLIGKFTEKFAQHVQSGDISGGIVLVNNATDTEWFYTLITVASGIVFTRGRVRFLRETGEIGAPLQGQAIIYSGNDPKRFYKAFSRFGWRPPNGA